MGIGLNVRLVGYNIQSKKLLAGTRATFYPSLNKWLPDAKNAAVINQAEFLDCLARDRGL